jgi:hypothetical protein
MGGISGSPPRQSADLRLNVETDEITANPHPASNPPPGQTQPAQLNRAERVAASASFGAAGLATVAWCGYVASMAGRDSVITPPYVGHPDPMALIVGIIAAVVAVPVAIVGLGGALLSADTRETNKKLALLTTASALALYSAATPAGIYYAEKAFGHYLANKKEEIAAENQFWANRQHAQSSSSTTQATPPSHLAHLTTPAPASWQVIEPRQTPKASPEPASKT